MTANILMGYSLDPLSSDTPLDETALDESGPNSDTGGQTFFMAPSPYASVTSALSALGGAGAGTLPASGISGRTLKVSPAEAIALGLISNGGAIIDGDVSFGAAVNQWSSAGAASAGSYDLVGTAEHEISELMGRRSDLRTASRYDPFDLFRYTSSGVHNYVVSPAVASAYFSIDGGATSLGQLSVAVGSNAPDLNDWKSAAGPTRFDAYNAVRHAGH